VPGNELSRYEFAGELALTGSLRPIRGALPMALAARRAGRAFVLPAASADEAGCIRDAIVHPAASLLAVCGHLTGQAPIAPLAAGMPPASAADPAQGADLSDVRGQASAKRVLEIAAAGAHSVLILSPSEPRKAGIGLGYRLMRIILL
jgi:magnesium chelatase family protein